MDSAATKPRKQPTILDMVEDGTARMCNCRSCLRLLLGESHADDMRRYSGSTHRLPAIVAGRIEGAPYCGKCLEQIKPSKPAAHPAIRV